MQRYTGSHALVFSMQKFTVRDFFIMLSTVRMKCTAGFGGKAVQLLLISTFHQTVHGTHFKHKGLLLLAHVGDFGQSDVQNRCPTSICTKIQLCMSKTAWYCVSLYY